MTNLAAAILVFGTLLLAAIYVKGSKINSDKDKEQ